MGKNNAVSQGKTQRNDTQSDTQNETFGLAVRFLKKNFSIYHSTNYFVKIEKKMKEFVQRAWTWNKTDNYGRSTC